MKSNEKEIKLRSAGSYSEKKSVNIFEKLLMIKVNLPRQQTLLSCDYALYRCT